MEIKFSEKDLEEILKNAKKRAEDTLSKEFISAGRALANDHFIKEIKNQIKGTIAANITNRVFKILDIDACIDKAMANMNKRIHTEISGRLENGIDVTFTATVGNPHGKD